MRLFFYEIFTQRIIVGALVKVFCRYLDAAEDYICNSVKQNFFPKPYVDVILMGSEIIGDDIMKKILTIFFF